MSPDSFFLALKETFEGATRITMNRFIDTDEVEGEKPTSIDLLILTMEEKSNQRKKSTSASLLSFSTWNGGDLKTTQKTIRLANSTMEFAVQ